MGQKVTLSGERMHQYETRLIKTVPAIARWCGVGTRTIERWLVKHAFPAAKLPDGSWATTELLISNWLIARRRVYDRRKAQHQGQNQGQDQVEGKVI